MADAVFQKHEYGKIKQEVRPIKHFDPRPGKYRGTANDMLPALLNKVHGQGLSISLLLDPQSRYWTSESAKPSTAELPSLSALKTTVVAFKDGLYMSEEAISRLERETRDQRQSSLWLSARRYRLTSSLFGVILHRRDDTPPDSLVLRILRAKQFSSVATEWEIQHEAVAIAEYVEHQHKHGHSNLMVSSSGLLVSRTHPFLGASPDDAVYDPSSLRQPLGFLEVKCPYSQRNLSPVTVCGLPGFCCSIDGGQEMRLCRNNRYFAQVQGQMAVGQRPWCDFVIYTTKGVSVERINFDNDYWTNTLPKLIAFYDNCVAPELVSPVHARTWPPSS